MDITELLAFSAKNGASDLHLSAGLPPMIRVDGEVRRINLPAMEHKDVHRLVYDIMNDKQRRDYEEFWETDFSFEIPGVSRFRVNAFNQNRGAGAVFRTIPSKVLTIEDLGMGQIFKDICNFPRGIVLVTGPTGSGKSTILRLLTGAFKDFHGNVLLDDVPIGNYSLNSIRSQTGILLNAQDIFKGSLLDNLTMGNEAINIGEVTAIANVTGLTEFVQAQKEGYDTLLDPAGKKLSKKVVQTILLIRALLGNHRLLLLEEPLHDLDSIHMQRILAYLKNDINATIIIATGNAEIAQACEKVLWLNKGSIAAAGSWQDIQSKIN